jgi:tetratricopeptide (TPR) repeat protein
MENPNPAPTVSVGPVRPQLRAARGHLYEPAIGPRLKVLLGVIFAGVALLGATGVYLLAITALEKVRSLTYTNQFTLWMFIVHVLLGVFLVVPFLVFGFTHLATARHRPNRVAVRLGLALFITGIVVGLSGLALIQLEKLPQLPTGTLARYGVYILHLVAPLVAVVFYVLHRRAGPQIQWRWGYAWGVAVVLFVGGMGLMHSQDPRKWYAKGPEEGEKYFEPSKTRTVDGNFIPAAALMMDDYCLKCHKDIYDSWFHSAHHFSSFNNPPYLFSVRETRRVSMQRDGHVRASRWCAGCHDVVPFLSGAFDDANFDDVNHPTAHAGLTCTACHAITNINSPIGNGDYTIEEPQHYPLAYSKSPLLQWLNNQVVKAKPDFHKKTFLKPFHRTAEFCSTCHKVSLPVELNHYKEFLRGQNHYDTYLLSGVSGVGARSFYYPAQAKTNCAECHMPLASSSDFGSKDFDGSGTRKIHNHLFASANTGLMALLAQDPARPADVAAFQRVIQAQTDFLRGTDPDGKDRKLRIDLFGIRQGGAIDGQLRVLRPELPPLEPGRAYLVEVVIRTLNIGHPFPQGTADSNEIWVDFTARSGDRIIGRSGALSGPGDSGTVDEWSHFVNMLALDRHGNRINRRNPQDIFTRLYDHQIPPGAAQVVHYALQVPADVKEPIKLAVRLRYRKFDQEYMSLVYADAGKIPALPIVDICEDEVTLPVKGVTADLKPQSSPIRPAWQRWNDYGIGMFLIAEADPKKAGMRQAQEAFQRLLTLDAKEAHAHGYLNLARSYYVEGELAEAAKNLNKAREADPPAPWWSVAWFTGLVNAQNSLHLDEAIADFEKILDPKNQPWDRKFDFTRDYVVINKLADTLFERAQQEDTPAEREQYYQRAVSYYERTLQIDPENLDAHYGLKRCFERLGQAEPEPDVERNEPNATTEALLNFAKRLANDSESPERRLEVGRQLCKCITAFGQQPVKPDKPKLATLLEAIRLCRPVYSQANSPKVGAAAARVLGNLYRETHKIFKPDELAESYAIGIYREKYPAAAAASRTIIIYPLDRP